MKKRAPDRRTEKTRRALKAVLIRLLQTRSLQKVSISELTELADISRGTFYLHYRDILDLYQTIQNEAVHPHLPRTGQLDRDRGTQGGPEDPMD